MLLNQDESAISFAQAEKLYYETFLINVGGDGDPNSKSGNRVPINRAHQKYKS